MSRTGKKPVAIPAGVTASLGNGLVSITGPKGSLTMPMVDEVTYSLEDGLLSIKPANETKRARAFWGM
jgi:large subunit ribosomal protein L6